jgi:hypothetical protein
MMDILRKGGETRSAHREGQRQNDPGVESIKVGSEIRELQVERKKARRAHVVKTLLL